jgi:hypothetical protein
VKQQQQQQQGFGDGESQENGVKMVVNVDKRYFKYFDVLF